MPKPKVIALAFVLACLSAPASEARPKAHPVQTQAQTKWVTAWASAQMEPESKSALPPEALKDITLRQIVRVSGAGTRIRLRLSNRFGKAPLSFDAVSVAKAVRPDSPQVVPGSVHSVTFGGASAVTLPAGAEYISDPVDLPVTVLTDLAISTWQAVGPDVQTSHPGSRATSYLVAGNQVAQADLTAPQTYDHWYAIAGIDVEGRTTHGAIAVLGDSITDGYGVLPNTNKRWPDSLMASLKAKGVPLSVLNLGIGGNRLLLDGLGPNAMARLDRDVFTHAGVKYLIVYEGVNDLGTLTRDAPASPEAHAKRVADMLVAYRQIIDQAHAHGLKVIGATIAPYAQNDYYHADAANEADRLRVNAWIRTPGHFDGLIDFDALLRDPSHPDRLKPEYDSGDHLHPTPAYETMGKFVDLKLFDGGKGRR
jgi:lysophospholipase L1-like esterase